MSTNDWCRLYEPGLRYPASLDEKYKKPIEERNAAYECVCLSNCPK